MMSNLPTSLKRLGNLHTAPEQLLSQGVIAIVPEKARFQGFYIQTCSPFLKQKGHLTHSGSKRFQHPLQVQKCLMAFTPSFLSSEKPSGLCGHQGCLRAYPYFPRTSTLPKFCCGLLCFFYWPVLCIASFHQGSSSCSHSASLSWYPHGGISGQ